MANPQKENGTTPIAHEILEALVRTDLNGAQIRLVLFVLRKTYGWHKKEDAISLDQFEVATGLDRSRICKELNALSKRRVLTKIEGGGRGKPSTYSLQKDHELWASKASVQGNQETVSMAPLIKSVLNSGKKAPETVSKLPLNSVKDDNETVSMAPPTKDIKYKQIIQKIVASPAKERPLKTLKEISNETLETMKTQIGSWKGLKVYLLKTGYDPMEVNKLRFE